MLPFLRKINLLYAWLLVALTDLAVTVPWILLFYRAIKGADWYTAIPGVWLALVIYAAASIWESGDRGNDDGARRRRVIAMLAGLAGAYLAAYFVQPVGGRTGLLSMNPALAFVPGAAYLWYQGTLAASEGLDFDRLFARYPKQIIAVVAGIVLLIKFDGASEPAVQVLLYWSVVLLLAGGLLALVAARERLLRAGQASMGEKGTGGERQSRLVAISVVVLLALTLAASFLMSADRMAAVSNAVSGGVGGVLRFIGRVAYLILYRWMLLIGPLLVRIIRALMSMMRPQKGQDPGEMENGDPNDPLPDNTDRLFDFNKVMPYLEAAALIAIVVGVGILVYRMTRKPKVRQGDEEEIINLGFWSNLWADLKSLMRGQAAVLAGGAGAIADALDPRHPRMLFRRLQTWGASQGRGRLESETPNAYGDALAGARPEQAEAVRAVTAVYNRARYGATAPGDGQVQAAADAVTALESEPQK